MCGLVGLAGWIGKKEKSAFEQMLVVDIIRGKDSTGVAFVSAATKEKPVVSVLKRAMNAIDFMDMKAFGKEMVWASCLLMGHNRWATKGIVNNTNAHPFEFDKVVGCHNGTLRSTWNLEGDKDFEVDSEVLYNHINEKGIDDAYSKMNGAAALTFWCKENDTLNLICNDERPLWYAFTEDRKTLVYASEWWMIEGICERNGIKIKDVYECKSHHLYTFKVPRTTIEKDAKPFEDISVRELTPYVTPTYNKGGGTNLAPFRKGSIKNDEETFNLLGKKVKFNVDLLSEYGVQATLDGSLADSPTIGIRIFISSANKLFKQLTNSLNVWEGVVDRRACYGSEYFLIISESTLIDTGEESSTFVTTTLDGQDEIQAKEDFLSQGCAWCGEVEKVENYDKIHKMTDGQYVGESCGCLEDSQLRQYGYMFGIH